MAYVPDPEHHAEHPEHGHPNYKAVFIVLCIATGLSWLLDELKHFNVPIPALALVFAVLAVAFVKAGAVMSYFMHLKFEGKWKFVILMPTAILAVGLMVALAPDMAVHYYTNNAPQRKTTVSQSGHEGEHPSEQGGDAESAGGHH